MTLIDKRTKEYIQGKTRLDSLPKILNIEMTNYCNLQCPMCVSKTSRSQGFISLDLIKKILKENKDLLKGQKIWLHFNGESLLHRQLGEVIQLLKQGGVYTRMSTNAMSLTKERTKEILEAGLDYIVFSVDGIKKETYEKIRKGGKLVLVEKNINQFFDLKKQGNYKTKTQIQIIEMKENKDEISSFVNKWKKTDVNYINIKSFCTRAGNLDDVSQFVNQELLTQKVSTRPHCQYLWETLVILYNGDVILCCQDLMGELVVGNVNNSTLKDIWNSPGVISLRERQLAGDFSMTPCKTCPDWKGYGKSYSKHYSKALHKKVMNNFFNIELKDEGIRIFKNK